MSTNHTPIYDFCLWKPEDRVLRVDFNENNLKIESELAGLSRRTFALEQKTSSLEGTAFTTKNPQVHFGSYVGDNMEKQTITLGFRPKLVLALRSTFQTGTGTYFHSGMALDGVLSSAGVGILDNGFEVYSRDNGDIRYRTNEYGHTYIYLAVK